MKIDAGPFGPGMSNIQFPGGFPSFTGSLDLNLRCAGIDNDCCTAFQPCVFGDGDCDTDDQCGPGLHCGTDNCGGSPFDDTDDCCEPGLKLFNIVGRDKASE